MSRFYGSLCIVYVGVLHVRQLGERCRWPNAICYLTTRTHYGLRHSYAISQDKQALWPINSGLTYWAIKDRRHWKSCLCYCKSSIRSLSAGVMTRTARKIHL